MSTVGGAELGVYPPPCPSHTHSLRELRLPEQAGAMTHLSSTLDLQIEPKRRSKISLHSFPVQSSSLNS